MKVKVPSAKSLRHYKHDISHDVSTTFSIGHIQPLCVRELMGNSKASLRVGQICRLMPLAQPTFGRMTLNTYNVFVPIESIYHPYGSFRAGQTYMGSTTTYIPHEVISCTAAFWYWVCKTLSSIAIIKTTSTSIQNSGSTYKRADATSVLTSSQDFADIRSSWEQDFSLFYGNTFPSGLFNLSRLGKYTTTEDDSYYGNDGTCLNLERYDWIDGILGQDGKVWLICGRYHAAAKNLRKILYGCGYKLNNDKQRLSMLPLLAYYKAYFDLFYPKRDLTWKDTFAAGIQEWCEQNGNFRLENYPNLDRMQLFIEDLCKTYYTQSPDWAAGHITGQRISNVDSIQINGAATDNSTTPVVGTPTTAGTGVTIGQTAASLVGDTQNNSRIYQRLLNPQNLDIMQRIYHRINAKTAIGADIREFLKTQLGVDYLDEDESYWIGSQKMDINISPIFSNAETSEGSLGEFAAQGSGGDNGTSFTYEPKVDGYWVCLACVVPNSQMCQGVDPNLGHVRPVDFFDPAFDSITLVPTQKKFIYGERDFTYCDTTNGYDIGILEASFGNFPNYGEYCVAQNIQNGDVSLMSKRSTYLPYTLDKLLPYTTPEALSVDNVIYNIPMSLVVNSSVWRYIGLYNWLGNFDRIFQNSGLSSARNMINSQYVNMFYSHGIDDNIIGHNYLSFVYWSSKLPLRDAFQTGAFDKSSVSVEKA